MSKNPNPICPVCPHPVAVHRALPPRKLHCLDCLCEVETKWRYAWAVIVMRLCERLSVWANSR